MYNIMSEIKICFLCDNQKWPSDSLTKCEQSKYERIKNYSQLWFEVGQKKESYQKISTSTFNENLKYHGKCYSEFTHKNNLMKMQKSRDLQAIKAQSGYSLMLCIICQDQKKIKPSKVTINSVAQQFLDFKTSGSEILKERLKAFNDTKEIIQQQVQYHTSCLKTENRKTQVQTTASQPTVNKYLKIDQDFLASAKEQLTSLGEESPTVDVKQLVQQYEKLIDAAKLPPPVTTMRRYIKTILESDPELMSQIDFYQHESSKPTVVANKSLASKLVCDKHYNEKKAEENCFSTAAKIVRQELGSLKPWDFNGSFDNFTDPVQLSKLIKSIIGGTKSLSDKKEREVNAITSNIVQYIYANFKSDRQISYESHKDRGFEKHRTTPLSVGCALVSYQANRSKVEIENLSNIGISVNYDKLERIVTQIAETSIKQASKNQFGIVLPKFIKKGIRPVFAADNIDLGSDAHSFHGADLMIAQKKDLNKESLFPEIVLQNKSKHRSLKLSVATNIDEDILDMMSESIPFYKTPVSIKVSSESHQFEQLNSMWLLLSHSNLVGLAVNESAGQDVDSSQRLDLVNGEQNDFNSSDYTIGNIDINETNSEVSDVINIVHSSKKKKALSWSAFHSVLTEAADALSNVAIVAPLYRRSPTEMPILIDMLKKAMNITVLTVGEGIKTLITLDGDLYVRAVKLKDYKQKWIIRLGALHTVIAALKCLGKYVEGSGIDTAWEISGMYGSATVNQIIEGRHIYRGIEAHTITLIALNYLYVQSVFKSDEKLEMDRLISSIEKEIFADQKNNDRVEALLNIHTKFIKLFEKVRLKEMCSNPTATFLRNYMYQVLNLLSFIGATRCRKWILHLEQLDQMCKYFHAHDQSNYSKWAVMYLADMLELQTEDPESWEFLADGNFAVSKNEIPFTSIDPDHAIEHLHRPMKIRGGFVGITDNESALERFTLTAPILGEMAEHAKRTLSIKHNSQKQRVHHELLGNLFANRLKHSQNLANVLSREGNPFEYSDLRNLITFAVPSNTVKNDILKRDELGVERLKIFREERLIENVNDPSKNIPFWDPLRRNNFKMFSDSEIVVDTIKKQVTSIRQEKQLYARMLAISKSRPELCPEKVIGEYEFTSIPLSNFQSDGTIITAKAKANETLIKLIKKMPQVLPNMSNQINKDSGSIVFVNGMDLLDHVKKRKPMKNASDLAMIFVSELHKISEKFSEIRLIFDPFVGFPITECKNKAKKQKKVPIHYHVNNTTPIKNLENFIDHVDTKRELAAFLVTKSLEHYTASNIKFVGFFDNSFLCNCNKVDVFSPLLTDGHNLKTTNQVILLNAIDVKTKNPNQKLVIRTSGTDIIIMLTSLYDCIPSSTTIMSIGENTQIGDLYSRLGKKLVEGILGWYSFQGMDDLGSFSGKGVTSQFEVFKNCDDDILDAFSSFGATLKVPETMTKQMEKFICSLYGSNKNAKNIRDLRYHLSVVDGRDANKLPPTLGTLIPHISRAYYQVLICKMSMIPYPNIPDATNYYWNITSDGKFEPVKCINDPAPASVLHFKKCNCKAGKQRCTTQSCTCRKNNLKCCDLCGCEDSCCNPLNVNEENLDSDLDGLNDLIF